MPQPQYHVAAQLLDQLPLKGPKPCPELRRVEIQDATDSHGTAQHHQWLVWIALTRRSQPRGLAAEIKIGPCASHPTPVRPEALGQDRCHVDCRSDVQGILTDVAALVIVHRGPRTRWPAPRRMWSRMSVPERRTDSVCTDPRPIHAWQYPPILAPWSR